MHNNLVTRYGRWVVNHPWLVILISLLIVVPSIYSIKQNISFTTNYRVFFGKDNPQLRAFDELEKVYTKNDNVMFIVTPKGGDVFTPSTLHFLQKLTNEAWKIPYSIRVDSITNFQHTQAKGDDLFVGDLVPEGEELTAEAIAKIRETALHEPFLVNRIISPNGRVTGVNVTVQLPGVNDTEEVPKVTEFVRNMKKRLEAENPNIEIRLNGQVLLNNAFTEASQHDMRTLVAISFGFMLITLAIMLRSISGTVVTMLIIFFSIAVALGLGLLIGFPITPPSAATPNIVLTVAIANSVHILVTFLQKMRSGQSRKEAMVESLRINMQPVFLASITTAIGFLSMNFSEVPPFVHLGNMVAFGVIASFFFSVYFLPALMTLLPIKVKIDRKSYSHNIMTRFGDFVVRRHNPLLWGMLGLVLVLIAFLPRNELNDVFVNYFDESTEFRQDSDYFVKNLSGLYFIDFSLNSGEPGGISNPQYLSDVEKFAQWFRRQPETVHVNTITDTMKRLNRNMHGDDPAWYRIPQKRDLAAQYLLLYEMSLPYGLDLNNQVNVDKSATRFTVSIKTISSNQVLGLEQRATQWLTENAPSIKNPQGSGPTIMFAHIGKQNIQTMLVGTTLALIMISMILVGALRSFKIGFISLLPNLIPAAMGFGLWGLLVGEIGLSLSIVAGMTLGIVVDDTVHFLSKYLRARRENHLSAPDAVRYAFRTVGMAILTTSVVLVAGFLVLSQSTFKLNSGMGTLSSIVITFALLADFLFLPPLLMKLEEKKDEQISSANVPDSVAP
jgi:predicted RND superfamily exporter protein